MKAISQLGKKSKSYRGVMSSLFAKFFVFSFYTIFISWINLHAESSCCTTYQGAACPSCNLDVCANRFWVDAEYLYWKIKDSPNPTPILVTAPVAFNRSPLIGEPGTEVLIGDDKIKNQWRSGGKFALGYWFDNRKCYGAEASYCFLPDGSNHQTVASSGLPGSIILSVPFFDTTTDSESSSPVARPNRFAGRVKFKLANRMQGAELNGLASLFSDCSFEINALAGFRYWNFDERLRLHVDSPAIDLPGEVYLVNDQFHTKNNFYGGQLGLGVDYVYNNFFFNAKGKLALGAMCEEVSINGEFITNNFNGLGEPITYSGGYFALPSNIGRHKRTCFAVLPEVNVNIGYQLLHNLRLQVGYTFLYVNKVLWAGKQINRNINPSQSSLYEFDANPELVGTPGPTASLKNASFWAQGLNVGIIFDF